jgi:hypothetical protein
MATPSAEAVQLVKAYFFKVVAWTNKSTPETLAACEAAEAALLAHIAALE